MIQLQQAAFIVLDKNTPFNEQKGQALDLITTFLYGRSPSESVAANKVWEELQNDNEFWTQVDKVFTLCFVKETKFLALKVLEGHIKSKWGLINQESKATIKLFVVNLMLSQGQKVSEKSEEALTNQVNMTVIQILKHEWNTSWKNFIPDLCVSSKQDQNLCENNLKVLKLLSQEVFDFSKNQMTSKQIKELKTTLNQEFGQIYELCYFLLVAYIQNQQQVKASLVKQTLECLLTYLSWIPLGYIFLTELIETLIFMVDQSTIRNLAIRCLTEIAILKIDDQDVQQMQQQQQKLFQMLEKFLLKLKNFFPCDYGFVGERLRLRQTNQAQVFYFDEFCQILTMFFTGFLSTHLIWIEPLVNGNSQYMQMIKYCLQYLICFSELPLDSNYKQCVEFWHDFTNELLPNKNQSPNDQAGGRLVLNLYGTASQELTLKNSVYPNILIDLRKVVVSKMSKPQEVLISIDENGMPYKEELTNTENNAMYELLRELLINLAKLNWNSTKDIIVQKLDKQVRQFNFKREGVFDILSHQIGV